MSVDYILNGQGYGAVGQALMAGEDPGLWRPFIDEHGHKCVRIANGQMRYDDKLGRRVPVREKVLVRDLAHKDIPVPVLNATSLRKEEWIELDRVVRTEARKRLRAWGDLMAAGNSVTLDGMMRYTYEYQAMSDPGEAIVDMHGITDGRGDTPLFSLRSLPLPITHCDFTYTRRALNTSRNMGQGLDTIGIEWATRRVVEQVEKQVVGIVTGMSYGYQSTGVTAHNSTYKSTVYGYTTFPSRNTYTSVTTPDGTNPDSTVADVLAMRDTLLGDNFFGPYILYHSNDWDQYMDNDYVTGTSSAGLTSPSVTLRDRLRRIDGISDVRRLDFWTPSSAYQLLLIQMTSDVVRAVQGMDVTTLQWEEKGGMKLNFKVMAIMAPQIFADYSDRCGICHGTTS